MGIPDHLNCLLRNLYAGQEQQLEPDIEQWAGSKLGKEYIEAVYCHPANLTYMQSTSCKMLGWMKHKLESRLPEEIPTTSDMQIIPDHLTRLLRNLYAGQEATIRTGQEPLTGFKIGKGVQQGCILSP